MKLQSLVGQTFDRLTVIGYIHITNNEGKQRVRWICKCNCGNTSFIQVSTDKLKSKHTRSCGCLKVAASKINVRKMNDAWRKYTPEEATARRVHDARYSDMAFDDFISMCKYDCYYCNIAPSNMQNIHEGDKRTSQFAKDNGTFVYSGLDRIDSNLPHSVDNCVPCCFPCNSCKGKMTIDEFREWIKDLYANFQSLGFIS